MGVVEGRKIFFFEKKKQKTFVHIGFGLSGESEAMAEKVFPITHHPRLFVVQKKF